METRGLFADKYKDDFQTVLRTVESLAILLCSSHDITKTHFATTYTNYNQSFEHSYHCGCKPFCFVLSHHSMKDQRHSCKINEAVGIRILEASEIRYVVRNGYIVSHSIESELVMVINIRLLRLRSTGWKSS